MRKLFIAMFAVLILGIAAAIGYAYWKGEHKVQQVDVEISGVELDDMRLAEQLINDGEAQDAVDVIRNYTDRIENFTETGPQWLDLLITASEELRHSQQLMLLYEYYPDAFEDHEDALLLVAGEFLRKNRNSDYKELREEWGSQHTMDEAWLVLDADSLLQEGKRVEAIDLLESDTFEGKNDVGRLIRLALIYANEKPKLAWEYLSQAAQKDPENGTVRLYRAKLLEGIGKLSLAHLEYLAATQVAEKSPSMRDQLAEFYVRNYQFPLAMQVWLETLSSNPSQEAIWEKALFWSRVATPVEYDWTSKKPPQGNLLPLINYLSSLKPGLFWNQTTFTKLSGENNYLKNHQSLFWLRLLSAMKHRDDAKAEELLRYNLFKTESWAPELELALIRILKYRKNGSLVIGDEYELLEGVVAKMEQRDEALGREKPIFFNQLDFLAKEQEKDPEVKVPQDLHDLLISDEAFSAAFIAAGWLESGIQLHAVKIFPSTFPAWTAYAYTQALKFNRGNWEALDFASLQSESPILNGLTAELLVSAGNSDAAMDKLTPLLDRDDAIGYRATWLSSLILIEKSDYEAAKQLIQGRKELAEDVRGKEVIARIALLEDNSERADQIYREIANDSAEAKSYLARKAFDEQNWRRARELTESLIRQYPNNPMLHENLKKIIDKQNESGQ